MTGDVTLEMALLCERAEPAPSGRPTLVGVFSRVGVPRLPCALPPRVLALELWGPPYATVGFTLRFSGPGYPEALETPAQDVEIERHGFVAFGAEIGGIPLVAEGLHHVDVLLDGVVAGGCRFEVAVVPLPGG